MTSANLDLVRSVFADWERGDFRSTDWAHPEIEYVIVDGPAPGRYEGLARMGEGWRDFLGAWEHFRAEGVDEYREIDDERVLALQRFTVRGKKSGLDLVRVSGANLFHLRDGKVTKLVLYWNRERALADLGIAAEPGVPAPESAAQDVVASAASDGGSGGPIGEILVEPGELAARVSALGEEISRDYEGRDLLLVGILKGAVFFLSDLMRSLTVPCEVDFMALASYGSSTDSSGVVRILKDLDDAIEGRDVVIVEDIVDSGLTLSYLLRTLEARDPASLEVCALLTKPARRKVELPIRYTGFEIENKFVIGYGLDHAQRFRNLPYVAVLSEG